LPRKEKIMNTYDKPLDYGKERARAEALAQVIGDYSLNGSRYIVPERYSKVYSEYLKVNNIDAKHIYSLDDRTVPDSNKEYEFIVIASNAEVCPFINKSVAMNYSTAKVTFHIVSEEDIKSESKAYEVIYKILFPFASNNGVFAAKLYDFGVLCIVDMVVAAVLAAIPASHHASGNCIEKGLAQRFGIDSVAYKSIIRNYDDLYGHITSYELSDTVELMNVIGSDALVELIEKYKYAYAVQNFSF
jgi:hypothetical protein